MHPANLVDVPRNLCSQRPQSTPLSGGQLRSLGRLHRRERRPAAMLEVQRMHAQRSVTGNGRAFQQICVFVFLALENQVRNSCNKLSKMEPKLIHVEMIWEGFVCLVGVFLELCEHSDFCSPLER